MTKKQSDWPSTFGELGDKYGLNDLPMTRRSLFVNDELPACKHPITGEVITSRAKWAEANRRTGQFERKEPIERHKVDQEAVSRDVDQAMNRAIWAADNGQSVLSKEARERYRENDRILGERLGVDLTNIFKSKG